MHVVLRLALAGALAACNSSEPVVTQPVAPAKQRDPKGPCAHLQGDRCVEHDALFTEANAVAAQVRFGAAPVDSGRGTRRAYFVKGEVAKGKTLTIAVEHLGTTTPPPRLSIHRWEPADDSWIVRQDSFTPAEPGGRFEHQVSPATAATEQLIAVVAEPATEFRVTITTR